MNEYGDEIVKEYGDEIVKEYGDEIVKEYGDEIVKEYGDEIVKEYGNEIVKEYGDEICKALPFTYAFSGCDTTSSFHNLGQCKWFNAWLNCPEKEEIIPVFLQLSNRSKAVTTYQLDIIEKYVKLVYYPSKDKYASINVERMNYFYNLPDCSLKNIPPSRLGLLEHVKRVCYQVGYCWVECKENVVLPDVEQWGRIRDPQQSIVPAWQKPEDPIIHVDDVIFTCTCRKSRCTDCKCKRNGVSCLQYCRCQRNCDND